MLSSSPEEGRRVNELGIKGLGELDNVGRRCCLHTKL